MSMSDERDGLRMDAYFYSFTPTGVVEVDRILSAVATAGKAYHHTEDWTATDFGESQEARIQRVADAAAQAFAAVAEAARAEGIYAEVRAERERAHAKHGPNSMESYPPGAFIRYTILAEEVGEIAKEFNEAEARGGQHTLDFDRLRGELIQTAAMASAWADAIRALPLSARRCPRRGGER